MLLSIKKRQSCLLSSQKGLATVEALPILIVFILLLSFTLGFFMSIHTGILFNISARTYAFDTFLHRSDLSYWRDTEQYYGKTLGIRIHGVTGDFNSAANLGTYPWPSRPVSFAPFFSPGLNSRSSRPTNACLQQGREGVESKSWICLQIAYGICVNPTCGGN